MNQQLGQLSLLVKDYDEAIQYYTQTLGFELLEDTPMTDSGIQDCLAEPLSSISTRIALSVLALETP
jgi:catechol 2,3-dioxygenase-like lactoylglutathione lyase family enzyme